MSLSFDISKLDAGVFAGAATGAADPLPFTASCAACHTCFAFPVISLYPFSRPSRISFPIPVVVQISLIAFMPMTHARSPKIVFPNPNFQILPATSAREVHGYFDTARIGLSINVSNVSSSFFPHCCIFCFSA